MKILVFALVILFSAYSFSMSAINFRNENQDLNDLEHTAQWILEMGYPLFQEYEGYEHNSHEHWEYTHRIIDKYRVNSHAIAPARAGNAPLRSMFSIRKGQYSLSLSCYLREISETGRVYEYWHKNIYCRGECDGVESLTALVTIADDMYSERRVVQSSNRFITQYKYEDGTEIKILVSPEMVAALQEDMRQFPGAFADSPLEGLRVKFDTSLGWIWDS